MNQLGSADLYSGRLYRSIRLGLSDRTAKDGLRFIRQSSHVPNLMHKARFIRRISAVSNAIETIDEMICFIIYCLNCIRHGRNATYERGLSYANVFADIREFVIG